MGGRNAEMTFGIGKIDYSEVFGATRTIDAGLPNAGQLMNLTSMPSDAVVGPTFSTLTLTAGKIYEITNVPADATALGQLQTKLLEAGATTLATAAEVKVGMTFTVTKATNFDITLASDTQSANPTLKKGEMYEVTDIDKAGGGDTTDLTFTNNAHTNAKAWAAKATNLDGTPLTGNISVGKQVLMTADYTLQDTDIEVKRVTTGNNSDADGTFAEFRQIDASQITRNIEAVQKKINTGRVQAGSQYAALESAVIYTTDLTAQYELGYNTVHDVNFSMETAHLAKNQILQQAATAMLAQANQGQQGLLQLIQG
jgi:flagellin-like hook-associated protein FlgL